MAPNATENLYRFHKALNLPGAKIGELMSRGLVLMQRQIPADVVSVFLLDARKMKLGQRIAYDGKELLQQDQDIHLDEGSELWQVLKGRKKVLLYSKPHPVLYAPLLWTRGAGGGQEVAIGVVRFEKRNPRAKFSVLERRLAYDFSRELAQNLFHTKREERYRERLARVGAMTDLTAVFASSLRVDAGLKLILQGVQQHFLFDRVRLYLVDRQAKKLRGELSVDIRGKVKSLSHEQMELELGSHRFVNLVLGSGSDAFMERYKESVLYLPLTVQGQSTGLLIVDNLISQHPIAPEDADLLRSFAGQIALAVDNQRLFDEVQALSLYDSLTGLPLRRYFETRYQEELYRAERFGQPMALIWMDVDYFKEINDTYGHQVGDEVLKAVGAVINRSLRKIDFPCRYGGDEILVLLPQSGIEDARLIATRLADEIRDIRVPVAFSKAQVVRVTVSQGIATFPEDAASGDGLMQKADEALYWAKSHGKNRLAVYAETIGAGGSSPLKREAP